MLRQEGRGWSRRNRKWCVVRERTGKAVRAKSAPSNRSQGMTQLGFDLNPVNGEKAGMRARIFPSCFLMGLLGCSTPQSRPSAPTHPEPTASRTQTVPRAPAGSPSSRAPRAPWCPDEAPELVLVGQKAEVLPQVRNFYPGFGNIEGPVWLDGFLYYSNIAGGTNPPDSAIFRFREDGAPELFLDHSGSNGLATDPEGRLYAATHSDGSIVVRDVVRPSEPSHLARTFGGARFNSPNDLVIAEEGSLYFTDPVWQAPQPLPQAATRVYRVRGDQTEPLLGFSDVKNPNGITLSWDETSLFVGGENGLFVQNLENRGKATRILSPHLAESSGIDGLGRDCAGNLYVTVHSEKTVVVLDRSQHERGTILIPSSGGVTNVAFGGDERRTLYVTSLGEPPQIHQVKLNVPGYPY